MTVTLRAKSTGLSDHLKQFTTFTIHRVTTGNMASLPKIMKAVVCANPGPTSVLRLQEVSVPVPKPGQVLLKILGFGINRAGR